MAQPPMEDLMKRCGSMYKLVVIAAKRAKELAEGAPKLVDTDAKKSASIALEEIRQGKVQLKVDEGAAKSGRAKGRAKSKEHAKPKAESKKKKS